MNALWRQLAIATNWPVLVAVGVLTSVGVICIYAHDHNDAAKQAGFAIAGLIILIAIQSVNYQVLARYAWPFYLVSLLPLMYTVAGAVIGNGRDKDNPLPLVYNVNGAYAWIKIGPVGLQPAELAKISFIMVTAHFLRYRQNYRSFLGLLQPFVLALVPLGLILKQPDLGTGLTFIPALLAMVFVAGAKWRHLFAIFGIGVALLPIVWFSGAAPKGPGLPVFKYLPVLLQPYQRDRVYGLFNSGGDINFQTDLVQAAMADGGWRGRGFGNISVGQHVPEVHNDMIFSIVGEQFGFIGCAGVFVAYIVLFTAGVEISAATREPFGKLAAVGIVAFMAGQTFINLMVVLHMMPVTGITLPFISYGGSSLIASFIEAALLLNIGQNRPLVMAKDAFEFE